MQSAATISVWANDKVACVRVSGRANISASVDFKCLIRELVAQKPRRFILDLSDCLLMDSTFLGVLAGMGQRFQNGNTPENLCTLELFNPSERVTELLDNLGVMDYFKLTDSNGLEESGLRSVDHTPVQPGVKEVSKTCLDAHNKLMELNPENVPKFKDVTRFLEEDLNKSDSGDE
jgi:anti-anti-sigma factor